MRPLRDLIARAAPPREPGPVEPVALLSATVRDAPEFDPAASFDRALFGLAPDDVLALGPVVPHVCEVAYEALERSGVGFDRLRTMRMGTFLGVSDPRWVTVRDAPYLAELLGLPGPATTVYEPGAGLLHAVHQASVAIRAGDIDLALVAGDHLEGVGAAVLGRPDQVAEARVRALFEVAALAAHRRGVEAGAPLAERGWTLAVALGDP
ncbi:MAG: beta-ketoacyl synthase N-terminal-like domain-containing protein, partial [Myxococcota bacterium]